MARTRQWIALGMLAGLSLGGAGCRGAEPAPAPKEDKPADAAGAEHPTEHPKEHPAEHPAEQPK